MKKSIPALLAALCLCLAACGQAVTPDTADDASAAAFRPAASQALPEVMDAVQAARSAMLACPLRLEDYDHALVDDPAAAGLLSDQEIAALLDVRRDTAAFCAKEEALSDVDVLFRALHSSYGAYYYFGAENYDAAEGRIIAWIEAQSGEIDTEALTEKLRDELLFMLSRDAHAYIGDGGRSYESSVRYEYFYADGYEFARWEDGYFAVDADGTQWYADGFSDDRVTMELTLLADGRMVYRPTLFCTRPTVADCVMTLRSAEGQVQELPLTWMESQAYRQGNQEIDDSFLQEGGLTYISVRSFSTNDSEARRAALAQYAADAVRAQGSTAIIYDLRSNGGGDDNWPNLWVQQFLGMEGRIEYPQLFADRCSPFAAAAGYAEDAPDRYGRFRAGVISGRRYDNSIPVLVLVDDSCGSAGESAMQYLTLLDNVLVIGSNSAGYQLCGNVWSFRLPATGIAGRFGCAPSWFGDGADVDFRGYAPDVWCDPQDALTAALALVKSAGLADGAAVDALSGLAAAKAAAQASDSAQADGRISFRWNGSIVYSGESFGAGTGSRPHPVPVMLDGAAVRDFTVTNEDDSVCLCERTDSGMLKFEFKRRGESRITIATGDVSESFLLICSG